MPTALLVVDLQLDFLPGGALAVPEGDAVIGPINRLIRTGGFDRVVATQDWHPPGHRSFASQHPGREPFDTATLDGRPQTLWPDHCVRGTRGAELAPAADTHAYAAVFRKGMDPAVDSYSGFFDNAHRHDTGLAGYLRGLGVDAVTVTGLAADVCVKFTALDAVQQGFRVTLPRHATRGINATPGDVERAFEALAEAGCEVV